MGHKKRSSVSAATEGHAKAAPSAGDSNDAVRSDCEKALLALRRGNHTKALRLMKDACARHGSSPLFHRIHGTVHVKVAALLDDPPAKLRHLRNAIDSSRRAVSLSPRSIEFAHFYANLLYEAATDSKGYEEVVHECERALSIPNPSDPARDSLQDDRHSKIATVEDRVAHFHQELRSLIQKSNIASISTWMKNLGNGAEEKFRVIPMRRLSDDPMEVRLVQAARRPNEIKKATKTPEERRKEIEVRVAAARLLQQKPPDAPTPHQHAHQDDDPGCSPSPSSSSSSQHHRHSERRKQMNVRKLVSSADRMEQVRSYWNSMSAERRRDFLNVGVEELRAHLLSSKESQALDRLSEALLSAEANGTWRFWACFKCGERFPDAEAYSLHAEREHMGNLAPPLRSVLPQELDGEWAEMLVNGTWKPVDVSAVVKTFECEQITNKPVTAECDGSGNGIKDDTSDSEYPRSSQDVEPKPDEHCNGFTNKKTVEATSQLGLREINGIQQGWPIADDLEREKLLEKIHGLFQLLVKQRCLSAGHLNKVIQFSVDETQGLAFGSQIANLGVDQSPICICLLGASQLRKIVKYLQDLSQSCGLARYSDKSSEDSQNVAQANDYVEKIVLSPDSSSLCLDSRLFWRSASENTEAHSSDDDMERIDANVLVSWLFAGPPCGEQLVAWTRMKEEKSQQGLEIFMMLDKEFYLLQSVCEGKCEHISYEEALHAVENICVEEQSKREHATKFGGQGYIYVLRKRQQELIERDNDSVTFTHRFELDLINNILKEAQALNAGQFGCDEPSSGVTSRSGDLECVDGDEWKMQDYLHQADTCVDVTIQRQKEQIAIELSKIDAKIMRSLGSLQQMEHRLRISSAFDYRGVVLPLLKSFMRARLEDLVDKDATKKSDAAREAFLAELERDAEMAKAKYGENPKEKPKDKKKNRDSKRNKDNKPLSAVTCNGSITHGEIGEKLSCVSTDDDCSEPKLLSSDEFLKQQEEFRRKIEGEEEERKLAETLEYQRRVENEAKQKHLEEQHKRKAGNTFENVFPEMDSYSDQTSSLDSGSSFHLKGTKFDDLQFTDNDNSSSSSTKSTGNIHLSNYSNIGGVDHMDKTVASGNKNANFTMQKIRSSEDTSLSKHGQVLRDSRSTFKTRGESHSSMADMHTNILENGKENQHQFISANRKRSSGRSVSGKCTRQIETAGKKMEVPAGENGATTLRPLHNEDDIEERFQEDLKKAVSQSLDAFQAQNQPLIGKLRKFSDDLTPVDITERSSAKEGLGINSIDNGTLGAGLKNEAGEYNCFLNVIIQSLWHLRRFRDEFMLSSRSHVHIGKPCVVCALYEIFNSLNLASKGIQKEPVDPTNLRTALSNLYPDSNFFLEGQMNDASEVLAVIFDCLHRSFTSSREVVTHSPEKNGIGHWDCADSNCIAHTFFGMDVYEKMNCCSCGTESRHLKYTSFFYNINANALRTMKISSGGSSFDELLRLVEMNQQLACDVEVGGCGKRNYIHPILSTSPKVFTTVLGWQNTCESVEAISATLSAISTQVDVGVLFHGGSNEGSKYSLVSVVCYYGQHYHCFAYNDEHQEWIMYDDKQVKKIGDWNEVLSMCIRGHMQPQVLMFESKR